MVQISESNIIYLSNLLSNCCNSQSVVTPILDSQHMESFFFEK